MSTVGGNMDLTIRVGARNETGGVFARVSREVDQLKRTIGGRSTFGELVQFARGGGAAVAILGAVRTVGDLAGAFARARREGVGMVQAISEALKTNPIFGTFLTAGENINELFTGNRAYVEKINREVAEAERRQKAVEQRVALLGWARSALDAAREKREVEARQDNPLLAALDQTRIAARSARQQLQRDVAAQLDAALATAGITRGPGQSFAAAIGSEIARQEARLRRAAVPKPRAGSRGSNVELTRLFEADQAERSQAQQRLGQLRVLAQQVAPLAQDLQRELQVIAREELRDYLAAVRDAAASTTKRLLSNVSAALQDPAVIERAIAAGNTALSPLAFSAELARLQSRRSDEQRLAFEGTSPFLGLGEDPLLARLQQRADAAGVLADMLEQQLAEQAARSASLRASAFAGGLGSRGLVGVQAAGLSMRDTTQDATRKAIEELRKIAATQSKAVDDNTAALREVADAYRRLLTPANDRRIFD